MDLTMTEKFDSVLPNRYGEGLCMKGGYYESRPGQYRVYFSWKGKKIILNKYVNGDPLETPTQCERLLTQIRNQVDAKSFDPSEWAKDRPFLFKKAVESWMKLKSVTSETFESRKRIAEKILIPYFGEKDIREIRSIHVAEFLSKIKEQGYSDKTCYNIIAELRACLRFHRDSIPKLPIFPTVTFQDKPIRWIDIKNQDKIFDSIPVQHRPIFDFMRYTGCRPNEARGLLRDNIHHDEGYIAIATVLDSKGELRERTKTKRVRVLPIIPEIQNALKPREASRFVFTVKGLPYRKRVLERIWNNACEKAGIKINLYNGLKHSFGMQRLNQGFSLDAIRAVMGHTSSKTTEKYAQYLTEKLSPVMSGTVRAWYTRKKAKL